MDATALWRPGVLEDLATQAGLVPDRAFDTRWAYAFENEWHYLIARAPR